GYSDTAGVVRALYYLNVPYGDTVSTIRAYAGAEPVESEIRIHGDPAPAAIQLTSSPGIFISSAGRSYSETLKATVTDRRGGPVPGRTVVFTVLAGRADVDDSLKTDHSGVASAEVHLEKNWCGDLVVVATTLHERPLEQIETGSNWSLWLESLGLMPVISRDYLLDAPTAGSLVDTLTATVRRR
ncbi:MAG TPA: hypothetical protein ENL08_01345, partial [Bacteroidetes bacterium]|nr:hypothetical protein [Bacteroidota bacterium]